MVVKALNLDDELGITGYSSRWVLEKLEKHCDDYVKAKGDKKAVHIDAHDVSDGKGYMSRVFITKVKFDDNTDFTLAMKIPTSDIIEEKVMSMEGMKDDAARALIDNLMEAHNIECDAISLVASFSDFPTPKVYYVEKSRQGNVSGLEGREAPGVIMMNALNGASLGPIRSVTKQQCINAALDFAALHNNIAQLEDEKWKNKFDSTMHWDKGMMGSTIAMVDSFAKTYPELADFNKVIQSIDIFKYTKYALKDRPAQLNAWTYVHGDVWTNNVMFKKHADGSAGDEVLAYIDYQIGFEGNPIFDICRFLTFCADGDVRREVEPIALKAYHDRLTELFHQRGVQVPYSLENVQELYDLAFVHEAIQSMLMITFAGNEHLPEKIVEAQTAKIHLKLRFNLLDAEKNWKKWNLGAISGIKDL
ncbi:unnamed protein product [Bursaphelenchus xylophilus]|uniref:(pine wood nematode) hypothetical protein n=1 Tax=Bursaphelenchus xylophilus TaxID=6326 RepID=A0A1I7RM21_BURXY|nr:unnamed protein product [Bursaphelenchus xylophilus]CAG9118128.1 unnamed protein product [Bursaphelenchus xylophilus]